MNTSDEFWDKWYAANKLEKVNLVETLPIVASNTVPPFMKYTTATFINSYLVDLQSYMTRKDKPNGPSSNTQQAHKQGHPFNSCTD
jgi:hypothetical protein